MIKVILEVVLLTLFVAAGLSSANRVCYAQQSTNVLTGEWVGNSHPSGRSEFLRLSLTENAGEMLRPLKAKLTLVQLEGSRVRLEVSSIKLVMIGISPATKSKERPRYPERKLAFIWCVP